MMMSMESNCFPTSSSFTKTLNKEFSSPKSACMRGPSLAKKKFISTPLSYPYSRGGYISPVTCCDLRSSSVEDNSRPSTNVDWRSFRAMLVACERTSISNESSNWVNPGPTNDHHPPATTANMWAHIIHEPEKGCLLVATDKLNGVHNFELTVILILSTDSTGPTGIILNKPSLREARSTVPDVQDMFFDRPLYFGGPLDEKSVLVGPKKGNVEMETRKSGVFEEVMDGVYYGTEKGVDCAAEMVKRNEIGFEDFRVFEGYCWWEKNKLREEIRDGYWKVIACSPSIFSKMD